MSSIHTKRGALLGIGATYACKDCGKFVCTCKQEVCTCFVCTGIDNGMILVGMALAAAGYAATGFDSDLCTPEEYAALEAYEAQHGIPFVVQTYFHAWCDAGKPQAPKKSAVHIVQTAYGKVLKDDKTLSDADYQGTCDPIGPCGPGLCENPVCQASFINLPTGKA